MSSRPSLTIAQIIEQFDISRTTLRRGIENSRFPGAVKDQSGRWTVPIDDLIAEGIKPRKTWLEQGCHGGGHLGGYEQAQGAHSLADPNVYKVATELAHPENGLAHELAHHASRIAQLEAELNAEKQLRAAAEQNATDLRNAMRMLETSTPPTPPLSNGESPARRRWWQLR